MENNERQIMSEEVRRFKVQKIEKYEYMIDEAEKKINYSAFSFGGSVLVVLISSTILCESLTTSLLNIASINYTLIINEFILSCLSGGMTLFGAMRLKDLISNIANKASLQTNLNMLKDELELDDEFQKTKRK